MGGTNANFHILSFAKKSVGAIYRKAGSLLLELYDSLTAKFTKLRDIGKTVSMNEW